MPPATIRLYFDFISPNAYLAWTQLPKLAEKHGASIEPVPVLFAALLERHGRLGPAEIPAVMRWMWKNILRKATLLGVPFNPPAFHPFNPILALRLASLPLDEATRTAVIDALFRAVWAHGIHVSEAEAVERVLGVSGLDGASLVALAQQPECKARLREQTDDALARGVFGVPTMELNGELFWGYDDFPFLDLALAGRDPLDPARWRGWPAAFEASATRTKR